MSKLARIWVDPLFKRKMKEEAARQGKSILEFSKELCEDAEKIDKKKDSFFSFRF